jgi:hypothetical protein
MPLVTGIRIKFSIIHERVRLNLNERDVRGLDASFYLGYGSPKSETFFTSPQIRKIIQEHGLPAGTLLGEMSIGINEEKKQGVWSYYFPFGHFKGEEPNELMKMFQGKGIAIELEKRFLKIQTRRPKAIRRFDQGYVTPKTTLSRFAFSYERGDIVGKEIIVLGDDDLMSIVLGLSGLPKRITVVEIDERLTDFIESTAKKEGF